MYIFTCIILYINAITATTTAFTITTKNRFKLCINKMSIHKISITKMNANMPFVRPVKLHN